MKKAPLLTKMATKARSARTHHYLWQSAIVLSLAALALVIPLLAPAHNYAQAAGASKTITLWSQTLDSCRRAITGSTYKLTGSGVNVTQSDLPPGETATSVLIIPQGTGMCPVQQGNCVQFTNTCIQWHLAIPPSGTSTYKLQIITPAANHAGCVGGSVCASPDLKHLGIQLFEFATITVASSGACTANVTNYNPNWTYNKSSVRIFPTAEQHKTTTYACTQADPIVFHESATHAAVTHSPNDCDGDDDADDHTTGAEGWSPRCDNDNDWNPDYRKGQHYTGGVSGSRN